MFNYLKNKFKIFNEVDIKKYNDKTYNDKNKDEIYNDVNEDETYDDENKDETYNNNIGIIKDVQRFTFLDKLDNPLSYTFGDFNDIEQNYTIHICIYKINLQCKLPFLQFLITTDLIPSFPRVNNFKCDKIDDVQPHTLFMNKCLIEVLDKLGIHEMFSSELLEKMFKGFIHQDEINVFVVFESLPEFNHTPINSSQWCLLAEIMDERKINDKFIEPIIKSFFLKHTFMTEIYNVLDKEIVQTPLVLYSCINDNGNLITNVNKSFIDITTKHEWLGDYYYFRNLYDNNDSGLQKYAVFIDNAKYILLDISTINDKQKTDFLTKKENHYSLYFHQLGVQYWYVKSNRCFTRIL
jgi:hypothetical protein